MFRIDCKYAHKPLRKGRADWMSCFDTCTNCDGPAISDAVHARFLSLHPGRLPLHDYKYSICIIIGYI